MGLAVGFRTVGLYVVGAVVGGEYEGRTVGLYVVGAVVGKGEFEGAIVGL